MSKRLGLVHVYTGNGKGKTTTAFGMALRAAGQNFKVKIIQFLKGGHYTGEFVALKNYMSHLVDIEQYGKKCLKEKLQAQLDGTGFYIRTSEDCGDCRFCFTSDAEEKEFVRNAFDRAYEVIMCGEYDMVFLDEVNNCIAKGLIDMEDVVELVKMKPAHVELVLTGRNAPVELRGIADLVTEMYEIKHPMDKGIYARRGVEF